LQPLPVCTNKPVAPSRAPPSNPFTYLWENVETRFSIGVNRLRELTDPLRPQTVCHVP